MCQNATFLDLSLMWRVFRPPPVPARSAPLTQPRRCRTRNLSRLGAGGTLPRQPHGHSPNLACHAVYRRRTVVARSHSRSNHRGSRFAPARGACGIAFVTTRPQPAAFVRVVTKHGSEAHESASGSGSAQQTGRGTAATEGGTGTDRRTFREREEERTKDTQRPRQLSGLGARRRAAWADRGAVRGHA